MQWRNTSSRYGVFSLFLHWGSALVVFGLFGLGLWMRELSYYDPWYHPAPALHKSIGILLAIALLVRIVWRFVSPPPPAPVNHGPLTRVASKLG
ncbi:TPA: cytochrome b, partial [Pseudomonas aeruginosa]|nr:cytochrome b [Pseudomonas aeruginosa]